MSKVIHIFRRDLRLEDNTSLIRALEKYDNVYPIFIFTPNQIEQNSFKSEKALQFLINSLKELPVSVFYGDVVDVLEKISIDIDAIFVNTDYTPFSQNRDKRIHDFCQSKKITFHSYADALLTEPEQVSKPDGKPYTIFTPFYKKAQLQKVKPVQKNTYSSYKKFQSTFDFESLTSQSGLLVNGGRKEGLTLLEKATHLDSYKQDRDIPSVRGTSLLSAHLKFGTVSVREVYHRMKDVSETYISEIYWRDFFTHIGYHFPHVFEGAFRKQYDKIPWEQNEAHFRAWCEGKTGYPIVDAGMRELNETGFMHNRVRMIVASFLVKDLLLDWHLGEKYFAQKLTDYDPAINNGNWQWAASTGCDAQPYFRIFNPWRQLERFDPECTYVKKWVPELRDLSAKEICKLGEQRPLIPIDYPKPIVDHKTQSEKAKAMFKTLA